MRTRLLSGGTWICGKTIVPSGLTGPQLSFNFTVRNHLLGGVVMQQITNTHAAKVKSPVLSLAISWLIILGTYFLLRLIFIIFGFHLYAGLLGGCLAFVPYLISTIYLYKSTRTTNIWIYLLGIALPNIIEKIVLYLMGAFLYGVDPANVSSALQRIASNEPYTNFFTHPAAPNIFSLSFFGWTYIIGSFVVCALLIFIAVALRKTKQ